ncbi:DUF6193 family natural product biosynthesis protein [Streptomyces somaliensis]|uniref:DUF6193 family natural product biosynthesis protein n=1 Tax=Streptomyces somaliensis TaxID=78355 RepID=UPI0020CE456B|nr:DUF6193 family natural product biosynthesis protein [Streptomyces somaliensis]MCP9945290.1 DUF6193 family natural product biosynthesis protein [Streptomyces somaliensis]MCP9961503.1 DUF6193 family natural product biosynthesis protein [Streptomyces somaliensis]MCP9974313.1 DUF6193 family natural product biosynthesis protein [Streptomyces somaliensis]
MTGTVEAAWRKILTTAGEPRRPEESPLLVPFAELVLVAYAEPLLRRLHPWTGMWELHFSRCTESRYTWDVPYIGILRDGRYRVEGPKRTDPRIAETDNARAAVAVVVDRLPPHCGPAFIGDAEELAAHERARDSG